MPPPSKTRIHPPKPSVGDFLPTNVKLITDNLGETFSAFFCNHLREATSFFVDRYKMLNFLAGRSGRVWHQPPAKRPAAEQEELLHQAFQLYTGQTNGHTHLDVWTMTLAWRGMTILHLGLGMRNGQALSQLLGMGMGMNNLCSQLLGL